MCCILAINRGLRPIGSNDNQKRFVLPCQPSKRGEVSFARQEEVFL
jgi:hypothetical protein